MHPPTMFRRFGHRRDHRADGGGLREVRLVAQAEGCCHTLHTKLLQTRPARVSIAEQLVAAEIRQFFEARGGRCRRRGGSIRRRGRRAGCLLSALLGNDAIGASEARVEPVGRYSMVLLLEVGCS
jgi:hypothetical protein